MQLEAAEKIITAFKIQVFTQAHLEGARAQAALQSSVAPGVPPGRASGSPARSKMWSSPLASSPTSPASLHGSLSIQMCSSSASSRREVAAELELSCSILRPEHQWVRDPRPTLTHRLGGRLHQRRGGTPTRALVPKKIRHVRPGNRRWSRGGCLAARQRIGPPCPILHQAGDSHARCSPAARHRLDIRDELGNGTEGGRWGPRLSGQPASPLDPHTLVWTALANSIADRRGLRVRHADKHPQANTPRPQVRTVHQSAALGPNTR